MVIELREEFLFTRHQCLEKAQHGQPLSLSLLAMVGHEASSQAPAVEFSE
jgi:hypothetical protein